MKNLIFCTLTLTLLLPACETTKVDDQAAKELDQAGDRAEANAAKAKQAVKDKVDVAEGELERAGQDLENGAQDVLERAEQGLDKADDRLAKAKAKAEAEGLELDQEFDARFAAAKTKLEQKIQSSKRAAAEGSQDAIHELEAALAELDAALELDTEV